MTAVLTRSGLPVAVVKVREESSAIWREQAALSAMADRRPRAFRTPAPLGAGSVGDSVFWSAQEAVFDRPHAPERHPAPGLFDEVSDSLSSLFDSTHETQAAHNDLTPWNLRRDAAGVTWLFDWEDCGLAPRDSDRTYFSVSAHAVLGTAVPANLSRPAVEHWREAVAARIEMASPSDVALANAMLSGLDVAARTSRLAD